VLAALSRAGKERAPGGSQPLPKRLLILGLFLGLPALASAGLVVALNRDPRIFELGFPRHFYLIGLGVTVIPSILLRPNAWQALLLALGDYLGLLIGLYLFSFDTIGAGSDAVLGALILFSSATPFCVPVLFAVAFGSSVLSMSAARRWHRASSHAPEEDDVQRPFRKT
jgi:hypothetical protein